MLWVQFVTLLALLQLYVFGVLVGVARVKHGVKAPATTGNEIFERHYRVQMNTLETLVIFLPSLWLAAQYWRAEWMAGLGAVYLLGRVLYWRGYVSRPEARGAGFMLSIVPTVILLVAGLVGVIRQLLANAA